MGSYKTYSRNKQVKQMQLDKDFSSPESHKTTRDIPIENVEEWEKQIWYYRSHLDVFINEYLSSAERPINLFLFQRVIARAIGNCEIIDDVEARSLGKTWKMALILSAISILYPESPVLVVSKTVRQSTLVVRYIEQIASQCPNLAREISFPIRINKDGAKVVFKNGSEIEAMAMNADGSNLRGLRKKIVYIDESGWVKTQVILDVLNPIQQYKRNIYWKWKESGFEDYRSKLIQTSSAYLKSCDFFTRFKNTLREMKNGNKRQFACALSYKTGVEYGIIDESFVEAQRGIMPISSFEMEWCSRWIGAQEGSYFPYELTESCRNLAQIEIKMAKGSKSRYLLSCDIATSASTSADNACITVLKISERLNGTFSKYLVFMRSYHGYKLEALANEIRKTCCRFPNIEKVIIDINAIGEGIISLLNTPFIDDNNKEYPPFVLDTTERLTGNALPIIRGIRADSKYNARMATATRLFLENKSLSLPVASTNMRREIELSDESTDLRIKRGLLMEEIAVFIEVDALQFEMGNIVPKITVSGNIQYESTSKKDRYTALGMANEYIFLLEQENKEKLREDDDFVIGCAYVF